MHLSDMKYMTEATIWKIVTWALCFLLIGALLLNLIAPITVPPQVTSFLLGVLVSIAVGYSVVCPKSSVVMLDDKAEKTIRNKQYVAGVVISSLLALTFLSPAFREAPSCWGLIPVIFLPFILIVRESVLNTIKNRSCDSI